MLRNYHSTLQFVAASNTYGGGMYNSSAAAELRWNRIQDSMARNPTFVFTTPRYFTAFGEAAFPYRFFVGGRKQSTQLDPAVAHIFFQDGRFPKNFYRRNGTYGFPEISADVSEIFAVHPIPPGSNQGAGNYVPDLNYPGTNVVCPAFGCNSDLLKVYFSILKICYLYTTHVNVTVPSLYPNPTGALRKAIKENLVTFYNSLNGVANCSQVFPYGI
jgi:unspecific peroxygenase